MSIGQNNIAQTLAAPYSVRPLPGAPVSTPLKWDEVKTGIHPLNFNIGTIRNRLLRIGDIWGEVLGKGIDMEKFLQDMEKLT